MAASVSPPCGVLLVGSVPLTNAEQVFRAAGAILGHHLRRIPDGETGERLWTSSDSAEQVSFWPFWTEHREPVVVRRINEPGMIE